MVNLKPIIIKHHQVLTASVILITYIAIQLLLIHCGLLPIPLLNADPGANPGPW